MKRSISKKEIRHRRIRAKIKGTPEKPRLSVFRSNRHIFAQLIDDTKGKTIVSASDLKIKSKDLPAGQAGKKTDRAKIVGAELAKSAQEKKIEKIVFDRGGNKYHGRVKAVAEGAKEGGLKF